MLQTLGVRAQQRATVIAGSLYALDQFHFVAFGGVDERDLAAAAGRGAIAQREAFSLQLGGEGGKIVDLECEVHQIGLYLHARAAGQLADFDLLVAVGRAEKHELRSARRGVAARDLQAQRTFVKLDGALEVVDAHPGMEEFFDGHG